MSTRPWHPDRAEDLEAYALAARAWALSARDSPLYATLALGIAEDPELLRIVSAIPATPPFNVLLAGVQLLLTRDDALAAWYPRLTTRARQPGEGAYAAFREFVLEHEPALLALARTRTTQTNEIGRCAVLMPVVAAEGARRGWGPVHAIDIGAAAGLNLLMDRVAYRYTDPAGVETEVGDGPVTVTCENRAGLTLPSAPAPLASRTGLDLAPVDVRAADAVAWLEALVWPEQTARLERLRGALALRRDVPVTMVAGDASATLASVVAALPPGPVVVWHSIALYQAPLDVRRAIDDAVETAARTRPMVRVGMEVTEDGEVQVRVGPRYEEAPVVAVAHAHGAWVDGAESR